MKYYALTHSLDPKLSGPFPQVEDTSSTGNENSIENFDLKFITTDILVPQVRIYNRAKPTDIISGVSAEFESNLLVSGKLKNILDKYSPDAFQYFETVVEHRGSVLNDYWFIHPTRESLEFVDYVKSQVIRAPYFGADLNGDANKYIIAVANADGFYYELERLRSNNESLYEHIQIINLHLLESDETPQFLYLRFAEGVYAYIVSETLMQQIVDAGCLGVEFRPIEMSFNDWLSFRRDQTDSRKRKSKARKRVRPVPAVEINMPSKNFREITVDELTNWIQETKGLLATLTEIEGAYEKTEDQAEAAFHRVADLLALAINITEISKDKDHLTLLEEAERFPTSLSEMLGLLKLVSPDEDIRSLVCLAAYCLHNRYLLDIGGIVQEESIRSNSEIIGIGFKGLNSKVEAIPVKKGDDWIAMGFSIFASPISLQV